MKAAHALGLSVALLFGAASASAQPSPPPAPVVVMPRALTPLAADYPAGAEGSAVVIVKLVVETDGSVSSAAVAEGKEPFSSAAAAAARKFRFAPAARDGVPIRAAIRVEVKFTAPVAEDSGAPPSSSNTAAPNTTAPNTTAPNTTAPNTAAPNTAAPSAPPAPIDVSVRGFVTPPGTSSMSRAEVRLLPGAFGDPFRAVEILPGVTPLASGLPYFFVRGAPPGNVGYFLDGIRVPLLYHLGLGPSVIHPGLVDRVDLYPGGYPARFGQFAGAIVSGETRGPRPEVNGEAQIRLTDAGGMLEVPFDGGKGSALVAGRYSYTALLFSVLQSNLTLDYWDYQARVSYDLTPSDTVTVFAFGARDFLADKQEVFLEGLAAQRQRTLVDTTFHRVDLRYDHKLGPDSSVRHAVTFGYDRTGFDGGAVSDLMVAARSEARYVLSPYTTLRGGANAAVDALDTSLAKSEIGKEVPIQISTRFDFMGALWADAVLRLGDRFEITPGLGVRLYGSTGKNGGADVLPEPRLSSVLHVTPWLRLVQASGLATQKPSFFLPGPGFSPDFHGSLQKSFQTSAGVEADVPLDIEAKLTLFRDIFFDMTDAFGTSTFSDIITPDNYTQRSLGSSIGMEVSLKRRLTKRVGGFLSYTLSQSDRAYGVYHVRSAANRTHVLNTALTVDLGRGFRAGARFVFYTGLPDIVRARCTNAAGGTTADTGITACGAAPKADLGTDLEPFVRLDARLEKRWSLGKTRWLSLVLEMQNATLSTEVLGVRCDETCKPIRLGPVAIPNLGLEGGI